ncbi:MAG: 2-phosphoglycerate kinase [Acidimicrobiales bacterium]
MKATPRHVVISDQEHGLPYSKGLMAARITATGLAPARAFHVAEVIEDRLHDLDRAVISQSELTAMAEAALREEVGDRYAVSFAKWQSINRLESPLVILLGGATGVGKSTIATMLASRLGITRIIPTDAIREVMRSMFSENLLPTLQTSSFSADSVVRHPLPRSADPVIIGFSEQASAVAVGIEALVSRAIDEGTDVILEGAHIVPGFFDRSRFAGKAVVVLMVVTIDDEELHRSHLMMRGTETRSRPSERYLEYFPNIRRLQKYIRSLALENDVPIVPSYNLDATLSQVIDLVVQQAFDAVPESKNNMRPRPTKRGAP